MKIELRHIKISKVVAGYVNNDEEGVQGYGGNLNIRPKYQREFVYKDKQRDAVIDSVRKGFPLNVLYWADSGDGGYEVMDGQQRLISICEYVKGNFSINFQAFHNLTEKEQKQIHDYELMVYFCEGDEREKLDWFETINIAGLELSTQEMRNAIYCGKWVTEAKRWFSRNRCPAQVQKYSRYLSGERVRQAYLETAIKWIHDGDVEGYMSEHQHKDDAQELWDHFDAVISWVNRVFPDYEKEMKGIDWGSLYRKHCREKVDVKKMREEIVELYMDDDVTAKKGIFPYVLAGKEDRKEAERHLSIRAFTKSQKATKTAEQDNKCKKCGNELDNKAQADHIKPWSDGGRTTMDNLQILCQPCNARKSDK